MIETKIHTDTTFFTNEPGSTLLDRFRRTLEDTQYFDVLVGYFRSSGFYQMYEAIENVDKTRILVGLGVDEESYKTIHEYQQQTIMDFDSHANAKKEYQENLIKEIERSREADRQLEIGVKKFMEFLQMDCPDKESDIKNKGVSLLKTRTFIILKINFNIDPPQKDIAIVKKVKVLFDSL